LVKLYWLNEREEALIEHVATMLDPACDGPLALAAVKARFAAVAAWATDNRAVAAVPRGVNDDAILSALARVPLYHTHGRYHFDDREFAAALRTRAASDSVSHQSLHLH
jgi:hypothetical protein